MDLEPYGNLVYAIPPIEGSSDASASFAHLQFVVAETTEGTREYLRLSARWHGCGCEPRMA